MAPGEAVRAEKAQRKPACMSRLFLTKRRPTKCFLPEARVIGAEPAYDFRALASANRVRSSPISASSRAPSRGPRPGKLSRISLSACSLNAASAAVVRSAAAWQAASSC